MSVEMILMDALVTSTDPAITRATISYGYTPADDESEITGLPLLILQRDTTEWLTDICGTRLLPALVNVAVVHVARGAQEARQQADATRALLLTNPEQPSLEAENETYDPDLRAWMVSQMYRVWDDAPTVPISP